jgi:hypothetical protein
LGAQMGSSAFFHDRSKYCHNGGMASAPSSRTRRNCRRLRREGPTRLGAQMGSSAYASP